MLFHDRHREMLAFGLGFLLLLSPGSDLPLSGARFGLTNTRQMGQVDRVVELLSQGAERGYQRIGNRVM